MSSMTTIRTEDANDKYSQMVRQARLEREGAAAARIIADKLSGAYITKRIIPKVKELLPGYNAYLSRNYNNTFDLVLHKPDLSYGESFYIRLNDKSSKRIDSDIVTAEADNREAAAVKLEERLKNYYELISTYNSIVTAYSTIRDDLAKFFPDIPYAWRRDA